MKVEVKNKYKYCSLLFDEMAISPGLHYIKQVDQIQGFVDNGKTRKLEFANHWFLW